MILCNLILRYTITCNIDSYFDLLFILRIVASYTDISACIPTLHENYTNTLSYKNNRLVLSLTFQTNPVAF